MKIGKDKIKVLQLVEDFKVGGLERVVANIFDGLSRDKYKPSLWCIARGGELADEFIRKEKNIQILNLKTYYNPLNIIKLAYLIRRGRYHIVHTHGYYASTIGRISSFLALSPKIVSHVHTTYFDFKKRHIMIEKTLSRITDRIICCSNAVKDFVVFNEKINLNKISTIYNGVNCHENEVNQSIVDKKDPELINIVVIASLVKNKGHKNLLEAISKVVKRYNNLKLSIVGDGPQKFQLENYGKSLGINKHIEFLGIVYDVKKILKNCDIVVLPSLDREGLGMAIIEGMCMAKPVIASNIGGIPELIEDGINGYLVPPGDSYALAKKIKKLIGDRELSKRMGTNGRKKYEGRFDFSTMIKQVEDLYDSLLVNENIRIY